MSWGDKAKIVTAAIAAILLPLAVAFVGQLYSKAIKDRELEGTFVELAVDILRDQPTQDTKSLRKWALDVVN